MNEFDVIKRVKEVLKEYSEILSCNIKVYKRTGSIALTKINNSFICVNIHSFDSRIYLANSESIDTHFFALGLKEGKLEELSSKLEYLLQNFKWSSDKTHSQGCFYDASGDNIKAQLINFPFIKSCNINLFTNRGITLSNVNNTPLTIYIGLNRGIFLEQSFLPNQLFSILMESNLKQSEINEVKENLKPFIKNIQHNNCLPYTRVINE